MEEVREIQRQKQHFPLNNYSKLARNLKKVYICNAKNLKKV